MRKWTERRFKWTLRWLTSQNSNKPSIDVQVAIWLTVWRKKRKIIQRSPKNPTLKPQNLNNSSMERGSDHRNLLIWLCFNRTFVIIFIPARVRNWDVFGGLRLVCVCALFREHHYYGSKASLSSHHHSDKDPFRLRYQHAYSPYYFPHISYVTVWENLLKHQDISSLVIISFILMTCMFDQAVTL